MEDRCLCQRCSNIRCLEEDLNLRKVKENEPRNPRYVLRSVMRHGRIYIRKETLNGSFVSEEYLKDLNG